MIFASRPRVRSILLVTATACGVIGLGAAGSGPSGDTEAVEGTARLRGEENWNRLRSMPREQRLTLWEKLKKFDALPRVEREEIRSLDAQIAQLPDVDRSNYESVLRRYHQWVLGLSKEQRDELDATPPKQRMALVSRFYAEAHQQGARPMSTPAFLQVVDFSAASPFDTAPRLKAWFNLPPEKRAEIDKLGAAERHARLDALAQSSRGPGQGGDGSIPRLSRAEEDALLARMEANPQLKSWLAVPFKKAEPPKIEKVRRRMAANYYFIEHPPTSVDPTRLARFEAALPSGVRQSFDPLAPEEARRRLTILYRLVFPAPGEMPEAKPVSQPAKSRPVPAPAAPRDPAAAHSPVPAPAVVPIPVVP